MNHGQHTTNASAIANAEVITSLKEWTRNPSPIDQKSKAGLLDELVADLFAATEKYESGEDNGRAGARMALNAIVRLLLPLRVDHPDRNLSAPIAGSLVALSDVDSGIENPMFARTKLGSRVASQSWRLVQAKAAFATAALIHLGERAKSAEIQVAKLLLKSGFRKKRYQNRDNAGATGHRTEITDRTIRFWRAEFEKAPRTRDLSTRIFFGLMDELKSDPVTIDPSRQKSGF